MFSVVAARTDLRWSSRHCWSVSGIVDLQVCRYTSFFGPQEAQYLLYDHNNTSTSKRLSLDVFLACFECLYAYRHY